MTRRGLFGMLAGAPLAQPEAVKTRKLEITPEALRILAAHLENRRALVVARMGDKIVGLVEDRK